ncbi:hypothetical protein HZB01_03165 [Candidatus Woesearchaeota archaeon]|nr:hypothetical protein [Candidatus Woesearchaeota archaeon]
MEEKKRKSIARDTPLAELTLRRYEKPVGLSKRELVRKLCLSVGLLQPGDSRDVIVDIFYALLTHRKPLMSEEVVALAIECRKMHNMPLYGIAHSNVRRQLKRLRDMFLVEKVKNTYRITENSSLLPTFDEKITRFYLEAITERVREYFVAIDQTFKNEETPLTPQNL